MSGNSAGLLVLHRGVHRKDVRSFVLSGNNVPSIQPNQLQHRSQPERTYQVGQLSGASRENRWQPSRLCMLIGNEAQVCFAFSFTCPRLECLPFGIIAMPSCPILPVMTPDEHRDYMDMLRKSTEHAEPEKQAYNEIDQRYAAGDQHRCEAAAGANGDASQLGVGRADFDMTHHDEHGNIWQEKRKAADGQLYTYNEFEHWYGPCAQQLWETAALTRSCSRQDDSMNRQDVTYSAAEYEDGWGSSPPANADASQLGVGRADSVNQCASCGRLLCNREDVKFWWRARESGGFEMHFLGANNIIAAAILPLPTDQWQHIMVRDPYADAAQLCVPGAS